MCAPVPRITGTCVSMLTADTIAVITHYTVAIVNYKEYRNTIQLLSHIAKNDSCPVVLCVGTGTPTTGDGTIVYPMGIRITMT